MVRKARGQTQSQLAAASELSEDTIRRIERGDFTVASRPSTRSHGLKLSLSTLFESYELNELDDSRAMLGLLILRIVVTIVDELDQFDRP